MIKKNIHIFKNPFETARAVAETIVKKTKEKEGFFNVAVSGGNTPQILFKILAFEFKDSIEWEKIKIFWVDERCVSPEDEQSNYRMTRESLLKHVPVPEKNIFRMKGENDPLTEASEYMATLDRELPTKNNLPFFDLILLGMGDDGHTASIFPDNLSLLEKEETVATATHPLSGQTRITLTGKTISNADAILFLITGPSKQKVLHDIMNEINPEKYPSYPFFLLSKTEVFADQDAMELVSHLTEK